MGYGRTCPDGSLTVFSVDTEEQAKMLLVCACSTNLNGDYLAKELVKDQTLENLRKFSDRLAEMWERIKDRWKK